MTGPIKLTKDDFDYIHWDKDSGGGPESFELIIHGESKSSCNTIKQQILENQEIVNVLKYYHTNIEKHPFMILTEDDNTVEEIRKMGKTTSIIIEQIIKRATGRDIKEILGEKK